MGSVSVAHPFCEEEYQKGIAALKNNQRKAEMMYWSSN